MRRTLFTIWIVVAAAMLCGAQSGPATNNQNRSPDTQSARPAPSLDEVAAQTTAEKEAASAARDDRDVAAQESMARSAVVQAKEIIAQTPFIWAGSVAALLAFGVSMGALWVTIGTARRQLRAYLMLDHIGLLHPTHDADYKRKRPRPPDRPILQAHLKNFGPTPAANVLHWTDFEILPLGKEDGVPAPAALTPTSFGVVAPGGVLTKTVLFPRPVTPLEASAIASGSMAIYARGWITYQDVFKKDRETRFLMRYQGAWPPLPGAQFYYCDTGNSLK